ncbi:hypothetical protein [Methylorubrum thiocyanatum]
MLCALYAFGMEAAGTAPNVEEALEPLQVTPSGPSAAAAWMSPLGQNSPAIHKQDLSGCLRNPPLLRATRFGHLPVPLRFHRVRQDTVQHRSFELCRDATGYNLLPTRYHRLVAGLGHIGRVSEPNMALIFGCVGSVRVMALFLNGYINNVRIGHKGAYARVAGAAVGCAIMGQFATALMWDALFVAHAPSFVIPVFGTLAGFEALSVYIAVLDGVSRKSRIGKALAALEEVRG